MKLSVFSDLELETLFGPESSVQRVSDTLTPIGQVLVDICFKLFIEHVMTTTNKLTASKELGINSKEAFLSPPQASHDQAISTLR